MFSDPRCEVIRLAVLQLPLVSENGHTALGRKEADPCSYVLCA